MDKLSVLGIMSGTSLDGIDFVLCDVERSSLKIKFSAHARSVFPIDIREKLGLATEHKLNVAELALLHHDLGRLYAKEYLKHSKNWKVDLIGLHGQTVFHHAPVATLQIGEGSYLSEVAKCPVICDFRVADLAAGGQGAPLATYFHAVCFRNLTTEGSIAIHNLGGISNVTYFPENAPDFNKLKKLPDYYNKIISFDTGPANMLIDLRISKFTKGKMSFDENGRLAASGFINFSLLSKWLQHPFFLHAPPKSCGREEFGEIFLTKLMRDMKKMKAQDQMATLTELTAKSIALAYKKYFPALPAHALFYGGGAKNEYLMHRIRYNLPEVEIKSTKDFGWPVDAVEGGAFAMLAAARHWGIPNHLPTTTGARHSVNLGKII